MSLKIIFLFIFTLYSVSPDIERFDTGFRAEFSVINQGRLYKVLIYRDKINLGECFTLCIQYLECESVNYNDKNRECELADQVFNKNDADTRAVGWLNYATPKRVDGAYSDWSSSPCSLTCGNNGVIIQTRLCNQPEPRYGGMKCQGESYRKIPCGKRIPCPDTWNASMLLQKTPFRIRRQFHLKSIPASEFPDEYQISFEVKLDSYEPHENLKSIVTFREKRGQLIRVVVTANSKLRCSLIINRKKENFDSDIPLRKWFQVDIVQQRNSKGGLIVGYTTDVYINKGLAKSIEFKDTAIWKEEVMIYVATNPPVAQGSVQNFFFYSGKKLKWAV